MTEEKTSETVESLGEFLLRLRREKKVDIEELAEATKIPQRTLRAMEADDYGMLPRDAFARGFYSLYAKYLGVDSGEILKRYDTEIKRRSQKGQYTPPLKSGRKVNTMAARPSMAAGSILGSSLVLMVAVIAFFCWYFSFNPATFLSEQLRSFQKPEVLLETVSPQESSVKPTAEQKLSSSQNFLTIDFLTDTTITVSIDNGTPEEEVYSKGASRSWYAAQSISMVLPEAAGVRAYFNGSRIELPPSSNGFIILTLP